MDHVLTIGFWKISNSRIWFKMTIMCMFCTLISAAYGKDIFNPLSDSLERKEQQVYKYALGKNYANKMFLLNKATHSKALTNLSFSGVVDFISFYRNMSERYPDMSSPSKNLEFTPYPAGSQFSGNYYRQPLIDLIVTANPSSNTSFAFEYAMSHLFTGKTGDTSRKINVQNLLQFHGTANTSFGNFLLSAGGGSINYSLSSFTMYNREFREPVFEKLPWDWTTDSFKKYKDFFASSAITTPSYYNSAATQGFILEGSDMPGGFGFSGFYGRSSLSTTPDKALAGYPSEILAGKVYRGTDTSGIKIGVNAYRSLGFTSRVKDIRDERDIGTVEFNYKSPGIRLNAEGGMGRVINPSSTGKTGLALQAGLTIYNKRVHMPVFLKAYSVDEQAVSLESAVLNSNPSVVQGGYGSDSVYNNSLYQNFLQEVSMMANNRNGIILKVGKSFKNFAIEIGNAVSQEKVNYSNSFSFEHMANAFPASRFTPWYQYSGPYHRIGNRFRRSIETIKITDASNTYKKAFNAADLSVKWKTKIFKRELLFVNFNYIGSIGKSISPIPVMTESSFFRMFYEEISAYYNIINRVTLIGFYSMQKNIGNTMTELSAENGKPVDQLTTGIGFGIDYDFNDSAGLFLRHRWMDHRDYNFILDKYKGQETTVELKIFF